MIVALEDRRSDRTCQNATLTCQLVSINNDVIYIVNADDLECLDGSSINPQSAVRDKVPTILNHKHATQNNF
jgi:hypothetical protein